MDATSSLPSRVATIRRVFRQIDRTARSMGLHGDGDAHNAGSLRTLEQVLEAELLFIRADLGRLADPLRSEAVSRCRRIVADSRAATKQPVRPDVVVAAVRRAARALELDGDDSPNVELDELSDDGLRVATRLVDEFASVHELDDASHQAAFGVAVCIVGNTDGAKVMRALRLLRQGWTPWFDPTRPPKQTARMPRRPRAVGAAGVSAEEIIRRRSRR